jgi:uncharacterized protein YidB (DUF937 family)
MGLFDEIMSQVSGQTSGQPAVGAAGTQANVVQAILGVLSEGRAGGLSGLLQAFEQGGLGHLVASWVGNGQNLPVTPGQVESVLGADRIQEIAQRAGIPPGEASQAVAAVLPHVIDRLTPNGSVEPGLLQQGLGMLGKFL